MNNQSVITARTTRKLWKRFFIGILILQAILELALGSALLFDFPTTVKNGFGITYSGELDVLTFGGVTSVRLGEM